MLIYRSLLDIVLISSHMPNSRIETAQSSFAKPRAVLRCLLHLITGAYILIGNIKSLNPTGYDPDSRLIFRDVKRPSAREMDVQKDSD